MNRQTVRNLIEKYRIFLNSIIPDAIKIEKRELQRYDVKTKWFTKGKIGIIPSADKPGLYFYVTKEDEILYIGKGNQKDDGGIGRRVCAHLNKVEQDDDGKPLFPYHQWKDYDMVGQTVKDLIKNGDFLIYTIEINPEVYVEAFETFLLTMALVNDKKGKNRPTELNFKVG